MTQPSQAIRDDVRKRYEQVMQRIEAAADRAGRHANDLHVVAVTKYAEPEQIHAMLALGHGDFGESRAQQIVHRIPQMNEHFAQADNPPKNIRWHMIGHLQRNKIKQVAPLVDLIHSVDTLRLAEELQTFGSKNDAVVDILLQVNAAGEAQKYGLAPPAVIHLAEQITQMTCLRLRGIMAMAPHSDDEQSIHACFQYTRELFDDLRKESFIGKECNILSMGMTHDFEIAIEHGANVLRIGRAFFGEPA